MKKIKWIGLTFLIIGSIGYFKLFNKTVNNKYVPLSADAIFIIDKKNIINTFLWDIITTPKKWKIKSKSQSTTINWNDVIEINDFTYIFHIKNNPANIWNTIFEIKSEDKFQAFVQSDSASIENLGNNKQLYTLHKIGITALKIGNKIIVGLNNQENKKYLLAIEKEIFIDKLLTPNTLLKKNINGESHCILQTVNNINENENLFLKARYDNNKISFESEIEVLEKDLIISPEIKYCETAILNIGINQFPKSIINKVSDSSKNRINKIVNFNIDSLLQLNNSQLLLTFNGMVTKKDSAITYEYDDNFNQIAKVVLNEVEEPNFQLDIKTTNSENIIKYWQQNKNIEQTKNGLLFTPFVFAKSYIAKSDSGLQIIANNNIDKNTVTVNKNCLAFIKLKANEMPKSLFRYLPANAQLILNKISNIDIDLTNSNDKIFLKGFIKIN